MRSSLRLAPELVDRLIDAVPDALLIVDGEGLIRVANAMATTLFGYANDELLGQSVEMLVPDAVRGVHRAHRVRYAADPSIREMGSGIELEACRADGTLVPVEISLSPIETPDGAMATIATVRDISSRRNAEAQVRHIQATLDATRDALFIAEPDTNRFIYANQGAAVLTGYTRNELLTMTPFHLLPFATPRVFDALLDHAREISPDSVTRITTIRRVDGKDVPIEAVLQFVGDTFVAAFRDISDRIAAAQELQTREREIRELVRAANSYVWSVSPTGTVLTHEGFLGGYPMLPDSMLGEHYSVAFGGDPESKAYIETAMAGAPTTATRTVDSRTFHISYEPQYDENRQLVQIVGTATDMTDLQRIHDALEAERDRFRAIVASMQAGLYITDSLGNITETNGTLCELVGMSRDQILATPAPPPWWTGEHAAAVANASARAMASASVPPDPIEVEAEIRSTDGTLVPTLVTVRRVASTGKADTALTLVFDLSLVKAAAASSAHIESQQALLADRDRIAQDLHDTVLQQIFAAGMQLQALDSVLDDEREHARVAMILDVLDSSVKDLRTAVYRLGSKVGANGGLRDRILDITAAAARALGFQPSVHFSGVLDVAVEERHAEHLCAVVRESLSNCARHAHASRIVVDVASRDGHLVCTIDDDGVGLDNKARGGSGLLNIADRAEQLGGHATFTTSALGGTRIVWDVPLD